ncbi:MAG: phosphotransferase [Caldilineaceae bacterium]|nr:phosphotransferase [Caldilineaceae bacterium]
MSINETRSSPAEIAELLRNHYNLVPPVELFPLHSGSNNVIMGVRSQDGEYALKTIVAPHSPAELDYEQRLLRWLAGQDLPFAVPAPLPTRHGELLLRNATGSYLLMPLLPGQAPDWHEPHQMLLVGAALGALHPVLARFPHATAGIAVAYGALDRIHPLLSDPYHLTPTQLNLPSTPQTEALLHWWQAELAMLRAFIDGPYRALPHQLIHGDFLPSNTLFDADKTGGRISAVLDFEFATVDARAIDLASALYFGMRFWENSLPLMNAAAFCRGYAQSQWITTEEVAAIPWLMRLRNAVSTIWWFGRQLAAGKRIEPEARIGAMQQLVSWLHSEQGEHFTTLLHKECGPTETM